MDGSQAGHAGSEDTGVTALASWAWPDTGDDGQQVVDVKDIDVVQM